MTISNRCHPKATNHQYRFDPKRRTTKLDVSLGPRLRSTTHPTSISQGPRPRTTIEALAQPQRTTRIAQPIHHDYRRSLPMLHPTDTLHQRRPRASPHRHHPYEGPTYTYGFTSTSVAHPTSPVRRSDIHVYGFTPKIS